VQLVLDWDGTCTVRDSLVAAVHDLGDPSVYDQEFATYGEALAAEIGTLRASAADAARWATDHVELRPGFHELVDRFAPVIVSSGLPQLILPVLEREGVELDVRSNFADPSPDGWRVRFRHDSPCPVCGDRCKRRSLPEERPIVFVGDGYSDRCASLACDQVFARDGLARYLAGEGVAFEPFDTLNDVVACLVSGGANAMKGPGLR
jgi:2-hydroxy-3-keto-5-methylthiopentenyl-1-phosphate phosphatase